MSNLRTLTVTEVVAATGLTRRAVYLLIRRGELPVIRVGTGRSSTLRVSEQALRALITGSTPTAPTSTPAAPRGRKARALDADAALPPIDNPAFA